MKAVIQRVTKASVTVDGKVVGSIGAGLLVLVAFGEGEQESVLTPFINKLYNMRIFPNESGRFDRSLLDISGELLLVPQFTLYADTRKGRRPEFFGALNPELAKNYFEKLVETARDFADLKVASGRFGAYMQVALINDGPVTIPLEINA
ncbi:MAG: D-tyrosyl-tRNA(Tyr) deacylase [Candidatus Dadabacteria bacterium]|nr:MAG: D-tyrosyl-tRNA(Tyr) deacylase [Candidatus Dadabacteria bacterium]